MLFAHLLAAVIAPQNIPPAFRGSWVAESKGCQSGEVGAFLSISSDHLSDGEFDQRINKLQILTARDILIRSTVDTAEHPQPKLTLRLRLLPNGKMIRIEFEGHGVASHPFNREVDIRCGGAER